jgi:UDP-N-acetylmuramyl tripeptide synthase
MRLQNITAIRGKITAMRYGNPARSIEIIVVAGPYVKTTVIRLLAGILRGVNKKVSTMAGDASMPYDTSVNEFFNQLMAARREGSQCVIIEATDIVLQLGVLEALDIDTLIITGEFQSTGRLLKLAPRHVVGPSSLRIPAGLVEQSRHISFGDDEVAEAKLTSTKLYRKGTEVAITIDHQTKLDLASPLLGYANAWNLVIATTAAYVLGIDISTVQESIADIEPAHKNFTRQITNRPFSIFVDRATSSLSIDLAVTSARTLTKRRLLVVSSARDMDESLIEVLHRAADRTFIVGSDQKVLPDGVDVEPTTKQALSRAMRAGKQDDIVLLLGTSFTPADIESLSAQKSVEPSS